MAKYKGCLGTVTVGATPDTVGNLTDWEYTEQNEEIPANSMDGTCNASSVLGTKKTTGSFTYWYDEADSGQDVLTAGSTVEINLYPRGNSSGAPKLSNSGCNIISNSVSANVDGIVSGSATWSLNGELTETAVP